MVIFETKRLTIKRLEGADEIYFAELFTDPKILELIPQKAFTESQILDRFNDNLNIELDDLKKRKCACGIFEKGNSEMIGLALFLMNEKHEKEIGYRLRTEYWGNGYGTETLKGMLNYYFTILNAHVVTADVNMANLASRRILDKFMTPLKEFFNERDNCIDRRYILKKEQWLVSIF